MPGEYFVSLCSKQMSACVLDITCLITSLCCSESVGHICALCQGLLACGRDQSHGGGGDSYRFGGWNIYWFVYQRTLRRGEERRPCEAEGERVVKGIVAVFGLIVRVVQQISTQSA